MKADKIVPAMVPSRAAGWGRKGSDFDLADADMVICNDKARSITIRAFTWATAHAIG